MRSSLIHFINLLMEILPSTRFFGFKRFLWRLCGIVVSDGVCVNSGVRIFGAGLIEIGPDTWVGIDCKFIVPYGTSVRVGGHCDIAPDVLFECGSHSLGGPERRAGEGFAAPIVIGSGSWIGARAVLLGGAELGPGSLVAAGAVLRAGAYPPHALIAGVPARVIRLLSYESDTVSN